MINLNTINTDFGNLPVMVRAFVDLGTFTAFYEAVYVQNVGAFLRFM